MNAFVHNKRAMTGARIARIYASCGGYCANCKRKLMAGDDYEIDHIIPLSNGGSDDDSNLQVLCEGCHAIKTPGDVSDAAKGKRRYTKHHVPRRFLRSKSWRR